MPHTSIDDKAISLSMKWGSFLFYKFYDKFENHFSELMFIDLRDTRHHRENAARTTKAARYSPEETFVNIFVSHYFDRSPILMDVLRVSDGIGFARKDHHAVRDRKFYLILPDARDFCCCYQ